MYAFTTSLVPFYFLHLLVLVYKLHKVRPGVGGSSSLASGMYICTAELSAHQQFTQHKVHTNYMDASREWKLKRKRT